MTARRHRLVAVVLGLATAASGCTELVYRLAMPFVYVKAPLPADRIVRNVSYGEDGKDAGADRDKHRLDLFLADGTGWPVLVFVHGGSWTSGDRALRVGGADVYANIGRFFAARGIGTAVISYRLQPGVRWRDQVDDVADAVAWVHREIGAFGGRADAIFLAGHSAGAQLVTRIALDPEPLVRRGVSPQAICGLVPVSGLAFDLTDETTYALGEERRYYETRFRNDDPTDAWRGAASPVRFARADAPPTLVVYGEDDSAGLQRQSLLLDGALRAVGASSRVVVMPGHSHERMVLALSRDDGAAPIVLDFVRHASCPRGSAGP